MESDGLQVSSWAVETKANKKTWEQGQQSQHSARGAAAVNTQTESSGDAYYET